MKARKSIVAVILTLCMILGCAAPVFATAESSNLSISVDKTTDVEIGDTVTVTLTIVGNPELASLNGGIAFDKEAFECTGITNGNAKTTFNVQYWDEEEEDWANFAAGAQSTVAEANTNGTVGASFNVSSTGNKKLQMRYSALIVATFKALKGGTATFKAYEDSSTYPAGGTYAFKGDGNSVNVTVNTPVVAHTHTLTPTAAKEATCTEPGNIAYWTCTGDDGCGKIFSDAEGTTEIAQADTVVPAKGHAYGAPTYEWAADHSTCTGTIVCANDASHTITETVTASVETVAATCEAQGGETYTATFTKSEFTTQTYVKDPADPALGHDLVKTEAVAPTCTEDGNIAYWTCKREGCGKIFSDEAGTVVITMADTVDPAKGHDYSEVTFTWADDYSKVTATSICKNDASHVLNETATATAQTTDASCTEDGKTVYTAEFPRDTGLGIQTKEVTINKLGHNMTPTAAKPATCTEAGNNAYYTCDRCNKVFKDAEGATETTVEAETLPALGHKVGETAPTVTWTGDTATVTFTCANCNTSVTEDAEVTAEDNILTASYNGVAYDKKHKDSATNVGSVDATAKDENGNDVPIQEDAKGADAIPDANLLTPQEAANKSEYTKDELQVVWQSEISATGSTGPVTLTFKVTGITAAQKILVFHFTGGAWKLEAEGALGASEVQVKFSSLSPVALVVQSAAPPATGDSNNTFIWAGAMVMAAIAASYVVMTSRKGKHEA